jgi:hypothetical protein
LLISSSAAASTNRRSQDIDTGPITSGASGNGVTIALATPPQSRNSVFCITIQAPIITSITVSMSALRIGRSTTISISAPSSAPAMTATTRPRKKLSPSAAATR